ncbi:transcription factor GTE4-like [Eucalyptus grandis]|uniref:transcription factor GTE4-like n=1 Tax=Eucalyptus grandis TaxID=71139 RepID=UPI00192EC649|nr:transcription factor GTE4-like [Eucalyptus grandis]
MDLGTVKSRLNKNWYKSHREFAEDVRLIFHNAMLYNPKGKKPVPRNPEARDSHKKDMTYEEKQRLSEDLQTLPSEKLEDVVQIIKKRNLHLFQREDEIEVDIDSVDSDTDEVQVIEEVPTENIAGAAENNAVAPSPPLLEKQGANLSESSSSSSSSSDSGSSSNSEITLCIVHITTEQFSLALGDVAAAFELLSLWAELASCWE